MTKKELMEILASYPDHKEIKIVNTNFEWLDVENISEDSFNIIIDTTEQ